MDPLNPWVWPWVFSIGGAVELSKPARAMSRHPELTWAGRAVGWAYIVGLAVLRHLQQAIRGWRVCGPVATVFSLPLIIVFTPAACLIFTLAPPWRIASGIPDRDRDPGPH